MRSDVDAEGEEKFADVFRLPAWTQKIAQQIILD